MAAFRRDPLSDFLDGNRDSSNLWLFLHIPKTAGSSLSAEIAKMMQPYRNIHVDYKNTDVPPRLQKQSVVDRFITDAQTLSFRSASGHIMMRHAQQVRTAFPRTKFVTVLRDPVDRVISDFRYQTTPAHPPYQQFIRRFPRIEDYMELPQARNKMFRFLAMDPTASIADAINRIEHELTFVGTVEAYEMSFNILFRLFGFNLMPQQHRRKTEANEHNEVRESEELRRRIGNLNDLDVALYEHFREALNRRADQWNAMLEASSPSLPGGEPILDAAV